MCEKLNYIFQRFYSGLLRQKLAMTATTVLSHSVIANCEAVKYVIATARNKAGSNQKNNTNQIKRYT
jgi:hypothetical protein